AVMRELRERYAPWSCVQTYRLLAGTFAHALRRGLISRNPMDGIAASERPRQRNKRQVARLDATTVAKLVDAGTTERWRAAVGLAGFAGLRLGELRALTWSDVDLSAGTISVCRSAQPDGALTKPKTDAGVRVVPLLPALRRLLIEWKLCSPQTRDCDLVICT